MTGPEEVRTSIILSDELAYRLKVQAAKERTHVSGLLRRLAEEYLTKVEDKDEKERQARVRKTR